MKAVLLIGLGEAKEALEFRTDHPKPVRKPGEVLVAVHATSVNPAEWHIRKGDLPKALLTIPQILGCDLAGVVLEADSSSKFKPGERVVGHTRQILKDPWGTYAEFVSAREDRLTHIPEGVSFQQAAALPTAGLTAWQSLAPSMPLAGKRVFVHGGAGGIGHFAVQIAKFQGAFVATTCSDRNVDFVTRELGADLAIDYAKGDFVSAVGEPYDLVVDLVGEEPRSWELLKPSGTMAAVSFDKLIAQKRGMSLAFAILFRIMKLSLLSALRLCPKYHSVQQASAPDKGLVQLAQLVAEGNVKVHIEREISLEQIPEVHEYAERSRTRGKIVVRVAEAPPGDKPTGAGPQ